MKPTTALRSLLFGSSILATATSLHAANIYWDGAASASWNTATNWSTVSGATTPDPIAVPGILDDVFFNMASGSGTRLVTLNADQSAKSLLFSYTGGTVNVVGGGAQQTLTLGTGGLTMAAGTSVLFGNSGAAANRALINLTSGARTWTNNSVGGFVMANGAAAFTRDVGATLNFNKVGTGDFQISTTEMPLVNGIVGNWAFNGTGTNMRYATITTGNIANAATSGATTFDNMTNAAVNYTSATAVGTGINASRSANTILYTGTGAVTDYNQAGGNFLFTTNGILAVGASGTLTLQRSGAGNTSTMRVGNTNELVIAGPQDVTFNQLGISGATSTTGALTYSGTGTLSLAAGNAQAVSTYGGGTTVNSGTVTLSGTTATLGASTGSLTMNGGILNMSADNNLTVGRLAGLGGTINVTNARTLNVNQTTAGTYDGVIAGAGGAFTLGGLSTNKLTLTGASTYNGATTVAEGTLAVNGSLGNTSTTIQSGGTLQGSGTIAGSVTVEGNGTLAPGNSIESLGTGALSFLNASTYAYELQTNLYAGAPAAAGDLTYTTSTLDIASGAILTLTDLAASTVLAMDSKLSLISYGSGSWAPGELFTYNATTLNDGAIFTLGFNQWRFDYDDTVEGLNFATDSPDGQRYVTMTVVPEPRAALLGGLGMLALLRRRRN